MQTHRQPSPQRRVLLTAAFLVLAAALIVSMTLTQPQSGRAAEAAGPDLTVTVELDPPIPALNEEVTIRVTAHNDGSSNASGQVRVYIYIDPVDRPPTPSSAG